MSHLESYPAGPSAVCRAGGVSWACSACQDSSTSHGTVSSQSQQQPFTPLSGAGDVNSVRLIAAISPRLSPPTLPYGRFTPRRTKISPQTVPVRSSARLLPPDAQPLVAAVANFQLRLRECRLCPPTATYRERYMRLKPQDPTSVSRQENLGAISSASLPGSSALLFHAGIFAPTPWTLGATTHSSVRFSLARMG